MCEDHKSCVFDVPLSVKEEILSQMAQMRNGEVTVLNERTEFLAKTAPGCEI